MEKSAAYRLGLRAGLGMEKSAGNLLAHLGRWVLSRGTGRGLREAARRFAPAAGKGMERARVFKGGGLTVPVSAYPEALRQYLTGVGATTAGLGAGIPLGLLGFYLGSGEPELPMPGELSMPGSPIMPNFPIFPGAQTMPTPNLPPRFI